MTSTSSFNVVSGSIPAGDTLVYEYGVRIDAESSGFVADQILRARRLYNNLVAIMRDTVGELQTFVLERAGPEAMGVNSKITELNASFASAKAEGNEDVMKEIAQLRHEQWKLMSGYLKQARTTHRAEIQERFLSKIGNKSSCATYQARCEAVNEGLGWGTANAVLDASLQAFKGSFVMGKAPRFAAAEAIDQDTLTLQFTLKGGIPADALLTGRQSDLKILPSRGCGPRKYGEFSFRLGAAADHRYATGTWQYHRPFPEGATVALARLVRRKIGPKHRWAIQLLVRLKEPVSEATVGRQPLAAVHFGWAMDIAGRRVAAVADSADPGCARLVVLPEGIEAGLERAAAIQGERDAQRDGIALQVKTIEVPETAPAVLQEIMRRIRATRPQDVSANRLHYLCRLLSEADLKPEWLEAWRKEDKLRWQDQTHIAKRARNTRKSFYRQVGIDMARRYDTIVIEPLDLAAAALKVDETTGEKTEFTKKARAGRVVAALYELETSIRWAATKTGSALLELRGPTATVCAVCGGKVTADPNDHQSISCGSCGAVLDRKLNGAAVAWQEVEKRREDAVESFWRELFADREARQQNKLATLEKKASGRREAKKKRDDSEAGARTESEAEIP